MIFDLKKEYLPRIMPLSLSPQTENDLKQIADSNVRDHSLSILERADTLMELAEDAEAIEAVADEVFSALRCICGWTAPDDADDVKAQQFDAAWNAAQEVTARHQARCSQSA